MEKVDNMQEQMSDVRREIETLKKESKESARYKKLCNRGKELLSQANQQSELSQTRISKVEDMSIETFQNEKQR